MYRGRWGKAVMRGKGFFASVAKLRKANTFTWPIAAIDNKTNWHKKWVI